MVAIVVALLVGGVVFVVAGFRVFGYLRRRRDLRRGDMRRWCERQDLKD